MSVRLDSKPVSVGAAPREGAAAGAPIEVENLDLFYGDTAIQRNLSFSVGRGEIFVIMGGSGCGKTTVMRCLVGLKAPTSGRVLLDGASLWESDPETRALLARRGGVVFQQGALWSSMTLAENVGLPLAEFSRVDPREIRDIASFKLAMVGLGGFEDYYPAEISGGMRKRAGVARALALDPEFLFFDEPSAGLDPITSSQLDDLILQIRDSLGTTMVLVTHELPSIMSIADNSVFLDAESKTMIASGDPKRLLAESRDPKIETFLTRCGKDRVGAGLPG